MLKQHKKKIKEFYNREAPSYSKIYGEQIEPYPANRIRLDIIKDRLKRNSRIDYILDCGCGSCGPMIELLKAGYDVKGFDFSPEMVAQGKKKLEELGFPEEIIQLCDLEQNDIPFEEDFESVLALGIFPHIHDEIKALKKIRQKLILHGILFASFRNDLFCLFTMNRHTTDFLLRLVGVESNEAREYIEKLLPKDEEVEAGAAVKYSDIPSKFHNPLTVGDQLFKPAGFSVERIHFYHYHAFPPAVGKQNLALFREMSLKMEKPDDWRGYFMASAFVVEARAA